MCIVGIQRINRHKKDPFPSSSRRGTIEYKPDNHKRKSIQIGCTKILNSPRGQARDKTSRAERNISNSKVVCLNEWPNNKEWLRWPTFFTFYIHFGLFFFRTLRANLFSPSVNLARRKQIAPPDFINEGASEVAPPRTCSNTENSW